MSSFSPSSSVCAAPQQMQPLEPVTPLEMSANRWIPMSISGKDQAVTGTEDSPKMADRKVRALLNKLTMKHFDSISDQIIVWVNKLEKERDGSTLIQVTHLVFEKATDESMWSEMYARLCRKMMERISPKVQKDGIKGIDGKPVTGGHLFRKYLLNHCQENFERGWATKNAISAAVASKAADDQAAEAAAEIEEAVLYSDEYYAVQKAKRQGLGLVKFIVELFKLRMLTERIMHECVKRLLGNVNDPKEEDIESLCKLLTTVGALLDALKARAHMIVYFSRMKELMKHHNVTPRFQFMLQDVIELRERKWVPRNQAAAAPQTIVQIPKASAKEKAFQERRYLRTLSVSRGGSRRDIERGTGGKLSTDLDSGGVSKPRGAPPQRRRLDFLPCKVQDSQVASSSAISEDKGDEPSAPSMTEAEAKARVEEDCKEFFEIRNLDEAEIYFTKLPVEHRHLLVDRLVTQAIDGKERYLELVTSLFARAVEKNLCPVEAFEKGFMPTAELLDDIVIDVPKAFPRFTTMIKASSLNDEHRTRLASKSSDSDRFLGMLTS